MAQETAERSRTKEGMSNRKKIGILMLCNERGYPLCLWAERWTTLPGKMHDGKALQELVESIEHEPWAQPVPIVFDRAMGSAGAVARLFESNLRFLTAVPRSEIGSYIESIPSATLIDLGGSEVSREPEQLIAEAGRRVAAAGMDRVDESLYVKDYGICTRTFRVLTEAQPSEIDGSNLEGCTHRPPETVCSKHAFPTRNSRKKSSKPDRKSKGASASSQRESLRSWGCCAST
jgi:hypothetical protein